MGPFALTPYAAIVTTGDIWPENVNSPDDLNIIDANHFFVGDSSIGTLSIDNGSLLESPSTFLGFQSTGDGSAVLTGNGSRWDIYSYPQEGGTIHVGFYGVGSVLVENQATLNTFGPYSQIGSAGTGTVTIRNFSTWTDEGGMGVGQTGNGTLNVENNSQVYVVNSMYIGDFSGGVGTVNVSEASSVDVDHTIWLAQRENTVSTVTVSGLNSIFEAGVQLRMAQFPPDTGGGEATLIVKDAALVKAPDIFLGPNCTITGDSNVEGTIHNGGGALSPGMSTGELTIVGDYSTESNTAVLQIEIDDYDNDFLRVIGNSGQAVIGGILDVQLLNGFTPSVGQEYLILKAEDLSGEFDIDQSNLPNFAGRTFEVIYGINEVLLRVIAISETANIYIVPDTLNLKSKGNFVTCYIELPEGYDVSDIDIETIKLNIGETIIEVESSPIEIGDYNSNGVQDLMVKFDRYSVQQACNTIGSVEMYFSCDTYQGIEIVGSDAVLVIDKGKEHFSEDQDSVEY
jgi:T5SS/PEP-CTERM-associated repeat protein